MGDVYRATMALELLLVGAKEALHLENLPLGGSHLAQIGLALLTGFAISELHACWRSLRSRGKPKPRQKENILTARRGRR